VEVGGEKPGCKPDCESEGREDKERRVREALRRDPYTTSIQIETLTGIPEQTVRGLKAWKERPSAILKKPAAEPRQTTQRLTSWMAKLKPGSDPDPAAIVEALDLVEREYLEQATPGQKADYHKMEVDDKRNTIWLWNQERGPRGLSAQ
jgi:hypothetical protein